MRDVMWKIGFKFGAECSRKGTVRRAAGEGRRNRGYKRRKNFRGGISMRREGKRGERIRRESIRREEESEGQRRRLAPFIVSSSLQRHRPRDPCFFDPPPSSSSVYADTRADSWFPVSRRIPCTYRERDHASRHDLLLVSRLRFSTRRSGSTE